MYGAILGDMIGSPYEFDAGEKTKEFPLFSENSVWTDDTVMTVAVADAFLTAGLNASEDTLRKQLIKSMRSYGKRFPKAGYGLRFWRWLHSWKPKPYNSYGNGSAMRVSSVAWLYNDLNSVRRAARISSEVTHNHPEGIKGAEATAAAIFLARTGHSKEEIQAYVIREFRYDLSRTCDEIRPEYHHVATCQETVPEAITAFLEGEDFENVVRTAVSLGGDCDTVAAIAGSIAEGFYGVPDTLKEICRSKLPPEFVRILNTFEKKIKRQV